MPEPTPQTEFRALPDAAYFPENRLPQASSLMGSLNAAGFNNIGYVGIGGTATALAISTLRTGPYAAISPTDTIPNPKPRYDTSSWLQITLGSAR